MLLLFLIGARVWGASADAAIVAAMRLSSEPNYSWVATITDDARTYDVVGQTTPDGFKRVKMPMINSVRRQLGRSVTDTQIELIFRGNVACVIETDRGWKTPDELAANEREEAVSNRRASPASGMGSLPGQGPGSNTGPGTNLPAIPGSKSDGARNYSNLQLGLSLPHEELGVIVSSHHDFTVDGDLVTGSLTELGAQLLLVRDGQAAITPLRAAGSFKLWLRDGRVVKYQVDLEGTLNVQLAERTRSIQVRQTTRTLLKDFGTTHVVVPDEARARLP